MRWRRNRESGSWHGSIADDLIFGYRPPAIKGCDRPCKSHSERSKFKIAYAAVSVASRSQPTWMNVPTPAALSIGSSSPGRPARYMCLAPAPRSALATAAACVAYTASDEHRHARLALDALNEESISS